MGGAKPDGKHAGDRSRQKVSSKWKGRSEAGDAMVLLNLGRGRGLSKGTRKRQMDGTDPDSLEWKGGARVLFAIRTTLATM